MAVMAKLECLTLGKLGIAGLKFREAALDESGDSRPATTANSQDRSLQQRPRQFVSMTAPINPTEVIVC